MTTLRDFFQQEFGAAVDTFGVRAPGRVNLIGEHVDYNDGFVLPMALPLQLEFLLRPRNDRNVRIYAETYGERAEFSLDHLQPQHRWIDYVQGVAQELAGASVPLHGWEGVVTSSVPVASGLSSSAALEVASALVFTHLAQQPMAAEDLALLCQRAEHNFIGVKCGIMDQMAVAACHEDHALMLDCRNLETEHIPLSLREHVLVVTDSSAPRQLAASAYNERRRQCEEGLALLQKVLPHITSLRDVTPEELDEHATSLPEVIGRRVRHVVEEIERTRQAAGCLRAENLAAFGALMNASHDSLAGLYEVTSPELDWLVSWSRQYSGVLGSRMTGAGFGGCTVTLLEAAKAPGYIERLVSEYQKACGREARCWTATAAAGATIIT